MTAMTEGERRPAERRRSSLIASMLVVEEEEVVEAAHGSGAYRNLCYVLEFVAFAEFLCD